MLVEIRGQRRGQLEAREPEPDAGVGREDLGPRAAGEHEALADLDRAERRIAERSSTIQNRSGSLPSTGVESRSSSFWPSFRIAGRAAASVAEVLTTTRSPGESSRGRSANRA